MGEYVAVIDYGSLFMFVVMCICSLVTLWMGVNFYMKAGSSRLYKKGIKLYLTAAALLLAAGFVSIVRDEQIVHGIRFFCAVAGSVWIIFCSDYLRLSPFFPNEEKRDRVLYVMACIGLMACEFAMQFGEKIVVKQAKDELSYKREAGFIFYVQMACLFVILSVNVRMFLKKRGKIKLIREKKLLRMVGTVLGLQGLSLVHDYLMPVLVGKYYPATIVFMFATMITLYKARNDIERASISVDSASAHLYEAVPMPVLILDREHRIKEANSFAIQFLECKPEEVPGRLLEDFFDSSFFSIHKRYKDEIKKRRANYEVSVTCRNNKFVCGLKYSIVYDKYKESLYAVVIVNDMSKQYSMLHKLEESRNRAEIANAAKSEFLANMSHEIRTPLNVILGMNEMILRESKEPEMLEYAENIRNAADSMVLMVNDVIDMSKMENGKVEISNAEYEVKETIANVLDTVRDRIKRKGIDFRWEIADDIPELLSGDEYRLRQIINKFLSNAEKYTKDGHIILRVKGNKAENGMYNLQVEVEDMGIGIKKEDFDKLFGAFNRLNLRENRTISGLGLGLSIVKNVVTAMGGEVHAESEYRKGSKFSFDVPQSICSEEKIGDFSQWYQDMKEPGNGKESRTIVAPQAKILAVDDTNVNLEVVKALLKRTKMQVDVVRSGQDCLDIVKLKEYHVILMDHMMPEMDGIETLKHLKTLEGNRSKNARIIALTANAIPGAREFYLKSGFDDYLKKPIKSAVLEQMLVKYLPKELVQSSFRSRPGVSGKEWAEFVQFEHINVQSALVYTDDNFEMLQSIMKQYMLSGEKNIEELNQNIRAQDWKNYGVRIHAIKSTSLSIGAEKLSIHAKLLEAAVLKGRYEYIEANHGRVMNLYRAVLQELEAYFAEIGQEEEKVPVENIVLQELTKEQLDARVEQLREKLDVSITTEIEKDMRDLEKYQYEGVAVKQLFSEIFALVEEYEYEKAAELIEEVKQRNESKQ